MNVYLTKLNYEYPTMERDSEMDEEWFLTYHSIVNNSIPDLKPLHDRVIEELKNIHNTVNNGIPD